MTKANSAANAAFLTRDPVNWQPSIWYSIYPPSPFQYWFSPTEHFIKAQSDFSVVHPEKVDRNGQYMSYSLSHHFSSGRHKRDLGSSHGRVYYNLHYKGRDLFFNLTTNKHLVANDYILERRHSELNHTQQFVSKDNACHLIGTVTYSNHVGKAAISTCEGLVSIINSS